MKSSTGRPSYAVTWRDGDGPVRVGKLELRPASLHLEGGGASGRLFSVTLRYGDLVAIRMARLEGDERLRRRPTLVLDRRGRRSLRLASLEGLGSSTEIFERLSGLLPENAAA